MFPENRRVPLQSFSFRSCETKIFDKTVIPPPLLCIKYFSPPEIFWNTEWFLGEFFSVLWDNFSTKTWSFPPPLLETCRFLSKHRRVPLWKLSALWEKAFSTEFTDIPFLCIKIFRHPEFSESPKCSPTKFFGTVRQKKLDEKSWYPSFA